MSYPSYLNLLKNGRLKERVMLFKKMLKACSLCPRECRVNREKGEIGFCQAGKELKIFNYQVHFGEEPPISGRNGSGTIFFSYCSNRCIYCQNWKFSQLGEGKKITVEELAKIMLTLQEKNCHNVNLVTPTHYLTQILEALVLAVEAGFRLPLVYNTSGYENSEILRLLEEIIDIYLPDMRYGDDEIAYKYSLMKNYVRINQSAIKEMYRQVGNLVMEGETARKGLLIRILILPHNLNRLEKILQFIKGEISPKCYLSLMSQYYSFYKARDDSFLNRSINHEEYLWATKIVFEFGFDNGWIQDEIDDKTRLDFAGEYFESL
ncbi:MAG: radical SAM protein [Candidatus Omnitrophica bacterium]|nr:radical SAM protein [Candidatus Omnitrophota bacterium]MCM8784444.1 radical SAM protein [Candidatus Omnitrophota bacterium]